MLRAACHASGAHYGDSATVGAGLPVLSSVRALVAGGDHIHLIEGVLSGSLAWLFHRYDGSGAFSDRVREAIAAGYTEPDPRIDLSGEDVRRKLLILARAAGWQLEAEQVHVESLVPAVVAKLPLAELDAHLRALDAVVGARVGNRRARQGVACGSLDVWTHMGRASACASWRRIIPWPAVLVPTIGLRSAATAIVRSRY